MAAAIVDAANGQKQRLILLFHFLLITFVTPSISVLCGHGSNGRCLREAAANGSKVTVTTSGSCDGRGHGQDRGGGGYVSCMTI